MSKDFVWQRHQDDGSLLLACSPECVGYFVACNPSTNSLEFEPVAIYQDNRTCIYCCGCGVLLEPEPEICIWHPQGCPFWIWRYSLSAVHFVRTWNARTKGQPITPEDWAAAERLADRHGGRMGGPEIALEVLRAH